VTRNKRKENDFFIFFYYYCYSWNHSELVPHVNEALTSNLSHTQLHLSIDDDGAIICVILNTDLEIVFVFRMHIWLIF